MGKSWWAALAALAAVTLLGCSSTVAGSGSADGGSSGGVRTPDFPSSSAAPSSAPSSSTPSGSVAGPSSSTPSSTPSSSYRTVRVQGTSTGRTIVARVYAADTIKDCAAHAYGSIVAFLRKHHCFSAHRVLLTTELDGRTVVVSTVSTGFAGTARDPYGVSAQFIKLERQDGTGSIDDLLRDGHTIAGVATHIPANEVFQVVGQDNGVCVFDSWYASGRTDGHDAALHNLELDLFLTALTNQ
jgi:hypothetical protein